MADGRTVAMTSNLANEGILRAIVTNCNRSLKAAMAELWSDVE